jgi:hypothetical protein
MFYALFQGVSPASMVDDPSHPCHSLLVSSTVKISLKINYIILSLAFLCEEKA